MQYKKNTQVTDIKNPYDVQWVQYRRKSLTDLKEVEVIYLITNSWFYQPFLIVNSNNYTHVIRERIFNIREFYNRVEEVGKKTKTFSPNFWQPGPIIEIYDISKVP